MKQAFFLKTRVLAMKMGKAREHLGENSRKLSQQSRTWEDGIHLLIGRWTQNVPQSTWTAKDVYIMVKQASQGGHDICY